MPESKPIPIICGPTASGKTGLAVELASGFPLEIVSADSRQVIKYLDIGTAKPTAEEREAAPVHCIDLIEPGERYSAYRFIEDAGSAICSIIEQGKKPVVVGGTGLYITALIDGVVEHGEFEPEVRDRLEAEAAQAGSTRLHERLAAVDPEEASKIHPNNAVRVIRALEIYEQTGMTKTELNSTGEYTRPPFEFSVYCIMPDREDLYRRIEARVDQMMADGLLDELEHLVATGNGEGVRRSRVIGYAELLEYLDGNLALDEAVARIKQNTRRFAKRQRTWFRRQINAKYFADSAGLLREIRKSC